MTRYLLSIIALTIIYALTLASFHHWDLVIGALLATMLVLIFHDVVFERDPKETGALHRSPVRRIVRFFPFAGAVIILIVRGTWQVLLIVLGIRPLQCPGIVAVPIGDRTPAGVAVTAIADTLSPGSVLVDVDWENGVMLIHTIDASDPDDFRHEQQEFYDRFQRHVFP